ncbi:MAG: GspH/FimT family pseudopilin [Hydrogenophaga sp.]|uniref:GspH/FimT family pseudopilin n=1 Tax=Hydrogenophaga sp. TaxID=1904254 RepID=UPI002ABCD12B|nr:GspH/FimT family pseudopilin [Hydrogenophaga sp.]MDZ4187886.1 GspH/FimT family pseudopilin [Hydrogenophaga sp.]
MPYIQRGWSLVELLTVLTIASVLSLAAVPALRAMFFPLQVRNTAEEFSSWMSMARSEAIKRRHGRVVVCVASSIDACDAQGDWQKGWLLFHDVNGNSELDLEDTVIRYQSKLPEGLIIRGNTHVASYISYVSSGRTLLVSGGLQVGTLSFCHQKSVTAGRQLVLSATGRVRLVRWTPDIC